MMKTFMAAALALPMLVTTAVANDVAGIDRETQRQVLIQCKQQLGIAGPNRITSINATSPLFFVNGQGLSIRQVRQIHGCAKNTYAAMRANGQASVQPAAPVHVRQTQGVPADTYRGGKAGHGGHNQVGFSEYQCPPNFSGMFRGTLYCVDGQLMR